MDSFGDDTPTLSESATADAPVSPAAALAATPVGLAASPAIKPAAAVAGLPAAPTLQQAVDKAVAKAGADAVVASDPHAVHHVKLAPLAPSVLGSTATGALIGSAILPGPGTLVGAGIGYVAERWQIGGGPFGKVAGKVKGIWHKHKTALTGLPVK